MFGKKFNQPPPFGTIHPDDDADIELQRPKDAARKHLWQESRLLFRDLIFRLRRAKDADGSISAHASAHGQRRREQGYSPAMLVEESRIFQVVTFGMLHLHYSELDQRRLLLDVIVIADEADAQLMQAVRSLTTC